MPEVHRVMVIFVLLGVDLHAALWENKKIIVSKISKNKLANWMERKEMAIMEFLVNEHQSM